LLWDIVEIMKTDLAQLSAEEWRTYKSTRRATAITWTQVAGMDPHGDER